MRVIVDTSAWSMALRRSDPNPEVTEIITSLISESRVIMLGPIRQELLSGIKSKKQFEKLKERLAAFPDLELTRIHYEKAAECFNACRAKGVQGSHIDFLICAAAIESKSGIYTLDPDFTQYAKHLSLKLVSSAA